MKTLQRYVSNSFLAAFVLTLVVLNFVLSVGILIKATELVVKGLALPLVLRFIVVSLPETLTFTLPMALLVSALLVFGRLSADGEISAMKACGVNLWGIMAAPLFFGVLVTLFCMYLNNEIAPRTHRIRRDLKASVGVGAGLQLLEPGRFIQDFPGMTFWFASRDGMWLHDLLIFDRTRRGGNREIRAERARLEERGEDLLLDMYKVRVDPFYEDRPGALTAERLTHVIPGALKKSEYRPRPNDYNLAELRAKMVEVAHEADPENLTEADRAKAAKSRIERVSRMRFELSRRFSMATACLCFVLIGMPLGIRAQRRESTIGVTISLVVFLLYYMLEIVADAVAHLPQFHPHLLAWIPAAVCIVLAGILVTRHQ